MNVAKRYLFGLVAFTVACGGGNNPWPLSDDASTMNDASPALDGRVVIVGDDVVVDSMVRDTGARDVAIGTRDSAITSPDSAVTPTCAQAEAQSTYARTTRYGLCAPINVASLVDHAESREAHAQCLIDAADLNPGSGTFSVQRGLGGRPSEVRYWPSQGSGGYLDSYSYTSTGALREWRRVYFGSSPTVVETFSYTSSGKISEWRRVVSDSTPTVTETFSYTSAGRISQWRRVVSDSTPTITETYSYTSVGRISEWRRVVSDSTPTITETYSYTSTGCISEWRHVVSDSTPTTTVSVSYSSNGAVTETRISGPPIGAVSVALCLL